MKLFGCITFIFMTLLYVKSQDPLCVQNVQQCAMAFQIGVSNTGSNVTETCKLVDAFIVCLDRVLQPCDLATRSTLLSAMDNLIDSYKREPYNCRLASSDNITISQCILEIGTCATYDLQAKASGDNPNQACSLHEIYKTCMLGNTTSCNNTERLQVNEAVYNSSNILTECPFNCYGMNECETTTEIQPTTVEQITSDGNTELPPMPPQASNSFGIEASVTQPAASSVYLDNSEGAGIQSSMPTQSSTDRDNVLPTTETVSLVYQSSSYTNTMSEQVTEQVTGEMQSPPTSPPVAGVTDKDSPTTKVTGKDSPTTKPADNKPTPDDKPVTKPTTELYPYRNDTDMTFPASDSKPTTKKTWNYGNNGASHIAVSGLVLAGLTLISSRFI